MKIRNGFVSNSSSSSFIIAINNCADEDVKPFFEVACALFQGWDDEKHRSKSDLQDAGEYVQNLKEDIKELEDNIEFGNKRSEEIKALQTCENASKHINQYMSIKDHVKYKSTLDMQRRQMEHPLEVLEEALCSISYDVKKCQNELIEKQKLIEKVEGIDALCLINIEVDNWAHGITDKIRVLDDVNAITIIEYSRT